MRASLIVEANYDDLDDREALRVDRLVQSLRILATRVEDDYKQRRSEHNKYGTFYQIYNFEAGSKPASKRGDNASKLVLNLGEKNV